MQGVVLSTHDAPEAERFSYWRYHVDGRPVSRGPREIVRCSWQAFSPGLDLRISVGQTFGVAPRELRGRASPTPAERPAMRRFVLSTDYVPEAERFSFWWEEACQGPIGISGEP
jgi:hypothetical protein